MCQAVDNVYHPIGESFGLKILIPPTEFVYELEDILLNTMNTNKLPVGNIIPGELSLWKLQKPWPVVGNGRDIPDINDLLQRFRSDGGPESTAEKLHPYETVLSYFKKSPPAMHLHLIVEAPTSGGGEFSAYVLWVSLLSVFAGCSASCTQN